MLAGTLLTTAACSLGRPTPPADAIVQAATDAAAAVVSEWIDAERLPGAVLSVSIDGATAERALGDAQRFAYDEGEYGDSAAGLSHPSALRRLDDPRPMTTDTVFDLASVTKVMATTMAVMLLVDEGALDLDSTLATYLSDFRDRPAPATTAPGAGKETITVEQLLTHRSGLFPWKPIYYHATDAEEAYAYIRDLPLAWPPGEGRHYSDLGFMLLGRIVEQISGDRLDQFLDARLYEPLGLTSAVFAPTTTSAGGSGTAPRPAGTSFAATSHGNPFEHRMVHDADFGYRIDDDPDAWQGWRRYTLIGEVNDGNAYHAFGGVSGHAGLFSTAADLQVLLRLILDGGTHGGRRYLRESTIERFLRADDDGQALGWQAPDWLPPGSFAHPGFTGTYVVGVPAANASVVLLTNRQNLGVDTEGQYPNITELQRSVVEAVLASR